MKKNNLVIIPKWETKSKIFSGHGRFREVLRFETIQRLDPFSVVGHLSVNTWIARPRAALKLGH
jgi:hypothetical protein